MRYLVLKFDNAKLFLNNRRTKDFVVNDRKMDKPIKRIEYHENLKEPITVYQVSNVIHVLFGERPVPTYRDVFWKPINYYFNKANESFIKLENYKRNMKDKLVNITEKTHIKKSVWCSINPISNINLHVVKRYLTLSNYDGNLYDFFVNESNKIFNQDIRFLSMKEIKKLYLNNKDDVGFILETLKKYRRKPLVDYLIDENNNGNLITNNYSTGVIRTVNNGIDNVTVLCGTIYVPVNDDDIERLKNVSTGFCTILDGGNVYIESILEDYEIETDDNIIKVCDISTDKI